jgi:monoamine oxidase
MSNLDVIIIGAGACGLMAARELGKSGRKVLVLEARNRLGGRIYTSRINSFSGPVEAGAEFVHGDLPLTQTLLADAGITCALMTGKSYEYKNGTLQESGEFIDDFPLLLAKLDQLEEDLPLADFLDEYLGEEEYRELRNTVIRFAEGYDAADTLKVSTLALREEWKSGGAATSYHPQGGYSQLIDYLAAESKANGTVIQLNAPVQKIRWASGQVTVITSQGTSYIAPQVLVTVPLGVLQSAPGSPGSIGFVPELPEKSHAFAQMGFGAVIKICLEFETAFWEKAAFAAQNLNQAPDLAFLFSDSHLFTAWWTQLPERTPLLTAWLAGPEALKYKDLPDDALVAEALVSLAGIFNTSVAVLQEHLRASAVFNWAADPFARGAYAYATVAATEAREIAARPIADTLYFAGEGLYAGHAMGTVEAALASGLDAAQHMLR